jgi:hypothetical protein
MILDQSPTINPMSTSRNVLIATLVLVALVAASFLFFQYSFKKEDTMLMDTLQDEINRLNEQIKDQKEIINLKTNNGSQGETKTLEKKLLEAKSELLKLKTEKHDSAKINNLKIVVISKEDIHSNTRILVGSIHKLHKDIKIVIYGIKLHPNSM